MGNQKMDKNEQIAFVRTILGEKSDAFLPMAPARNNIRTAMNFVMNLCTSENYADRNLGLDFLFQMDKRLNEMHNEMARKNRY